MSNLQHEYIDVKLVRKAFDPQTGPLTDMSLPIAERESQLHIYSVVPFGRYKNPHSHRDVNANINQCLVVLMLASDLHRILDEIEKNQNGGK